MISQEENSLLTQTGPGTPCGALLRRYWQPIALTEELPRGGPACKVRLVSEDLVLFRDDEGRPGLLGIHCSHRGTDLTYGRVEAGGLRCLYHGWLYDIHGKVLQQPGEPGGGANRHAIRHLAYPCQERGGVIFAYLGPGEPPLLPNYEFLSVSEEQRTVSKILLNCNYLQANEGNLDPVHLSFLHQKLEETEIDPHRIVPGSNASDNSLLAQDIAPMIQVEVMNFGLRIYAIRKSGPADCYLRVTNFILPNLAAFGGSTVAEGYSVHWHVPVDDTSHWKYVFMFSRERPLTPELRNKNTFEMTTDYRLMRNAANRYQQDPDSMKSRSFTGMGFNFQAHDAFATESQGPIQDRTAEHPVSSDKAIIAARKLLVSAIKAVQEGHEPPHMVRDVKRNRFLHLVVHSALLPASTDWKQYIKDLEADHEREFRIPG